MPHSEVPVQDIMGAQHSALTETRPCVYTCLHFIGIVLQTHIEALHFLYLCDNIGTIAGTSAMTGEAGRPNRKKKLHEATINDKTYCIYNTGEFAEN